MMSWYIDHTKSILMSESSDISRHLCTSSHRSPLVNSCVSGNRLCTACCQNDGFWSNKWAIKRTQSFTIGPCQIRSSDNMIGCVINLWSHLYVEWSTFWLEILLFAGPANIDTVLFFCVCRGSKAASQQKAMKIWKKTHENDLLFFLLELVKGFFPKHEIWIKSCAFESAKVRLLPNM